ncbi:MAG TPA: hypothetical protein VMX75_10730 [Spirochaetia bacterium]|nr:hypothetical protein [Spirochaetia bacterium]
MLTSIGRFDIHEITRRHRTFWNRESCELPILGVYPDRVRLPKGFLPRERRTLRPEDLDFERLTDTLEGLLAIDGGLGMAPVAIPSWEIQWAELIMGCEIETSDGNLWAKGIGDRERFLAEKTLLLDERWLDKLEDVFRTLDRHSNGRYLLSPSLIRGATDSLAALIGHEEMCLMMMDNPMDSSLLLGACTEAAIRISRRELGMVPHPEGGNANRFGLWAPGETIVFQEDAAVLLSPALFEELVLPWDVKMAESVEYPVYHLHSPCVSYVAPRLLEIDAVVAIQIRVDPVGPTMEELLPEFQRVQEKKPLIIGGNFSAADLAWLTDNLHPGWLEIIADRKSILEFLAGR